MNIDELTKLERSRAACRRWRAKDPGRANRLRRQSQLRNLEAYRKTHAAYVRAYRQKHPERMRASDKRRRSNPLRRISECIAVNMRRSLKAGKQGRRWELLVGYTCQQLKEHLETLWQDDMSWGNFGDWHIDHKRPISSFDYESYMDKDFTECWSLSNLQPLWACDNMHKGATYQEDAA